MLDKLLCFMQGPPYIPDHTHIAHSTQYDIRFTTTLCDSGSKRFQNDLTQCSIHSIKNIENKFSTFCVGFSFCSSNRLEYLTCAGTLK